MKAGYQLRLKPSSDNSEPDEFILSPLARRDSYYVGSVPKLATSVLAVNLANLASLHVGGHSELRNTNTVCFI